MRRLTFLFKPQWLALYVVAIAFAYLCFTVLAPWQLGKNTRTSRENDQIARSLSQAPVPVSSLLPQQDSSAAGAQWRQVTATGRYQTDAQVLARLRVVDGHPAYEVLLPFHVDGAPPCSSTVATSNPSRARACPSSPPHRAAPSPSPRVCGTPRASSRARIRSAKTVCSRCTPSTSRRYPPSPVCPWRSYLQLVGDQPGGLGTIGLPHLDAGPFLSYGIQWIAFGIIAPIGVGYFVFAEVRQRRLERTQIESRATDPAPLTTEEKLADRYGRRS